MRLLALSACLSLLGAAVLLPISAEAQPCPGGPGPGQSIIGTYDVGGSMRVPLCAGDGSAGDGDSAPSVPIGQREAERERRVEAEQFAYILREGADVARQAEAFLAEAERMRSGLPAGTPAPGPAQDMRRGRWGYAPSAYCGAAFTSPYGLISITGPGPGEPGVFLTFWTPAISKPRSPRQVRIRLQQTGDAAPVSVRAMNYNDTAVGLGAIIVGVPSTDALLDNMLDSHGFRIWVGNDKVVDMEWQNGLSARDRVRECLRQQAG